MTEQVHAIEYRVTPGGRTSAILSPVGFGSAMAGADRSTSPTRTTSRALVKSHPDAWYADVVTFETSGGQRVATERFAAERTIAGWIMSLGELDNPREALPAHLRSDAPKPKDGRA